MPIHSSIFKARQAEAGKIKIGALGETRKSKKGDDYQLPVKHDYFTITKTARDPATGNFVADEEIMAQLPKDPDGKIRRLPVVFDTDDIDELIPHRLALYQGRNLLCRGDGHAPATRFEILAGVKTGKTEEVTCPCPYLNAEKGHKCLPHATLWCTIAAGKETILGARHSFRTTGWNSISGLLGGLKAIQRQLGSLAGLPMWLRIKQQAARPKGLNKATTIPVVYVECRTEDLIGLQQHAIALAQARQRVVQVRNYEVLGLPEPGDDSETPEEQAKIREEWHPESPAEDIDYDPVTGEVYDTDAVEPPSNADDVDPPSDTDAVDPPSPEPGSQEEQRLDPSADLPDEHPIRTRIKGLLTDLAKARDFSEGDMKKGRSEIWAEVTEAVELPQLPWKSLTTARAMRIDEKLTELLQAGEPPF